MGEKYRTVPFYNGVSTFKAAFPDLNDAVIEWRERRGPEDEKPSDVRKTGFRRGNFTQGIAPCSNLSCHEGGYQLDRLVSDMLSLGETQREGMMLCSGREVAEEVRRGPVRCPHRIHFKATLVPHVEGEAPQRKQQPRRGRHRPARGKSVA